MRLLLGVLTNQNLKSKKYSTHILLIEKATNMSPYKFELEFKLRFELIFKVN